MCFSVTAGFSEAPNAFLSCVLYICVLRLLITESEAVVDQSRDP